MEDAVSVKAAQHHVLYRRKTMMIQALIVPEDAKSTT